MLNPLTIPRPQKSVSQHSGEPNVHPNATARAVAAPTFLFLFLLPRQAPAQHMDHAMDPEAGHRMFRLPLGDWHVVGMGQVFPVVTTGGPDNGDGGELRRTEWYLTQPALMANLESPSRRLVFRTTLNFEAVTGDSGWLSPAVSAKNVVARSTPLELSSSGRR